MRYAYFYPTRGSLKLGNHFAEAIVKQLQESLAVLSPELVPVHQKLVTIRRQLVTLAAKEGSQKAELKPLQEELRRIDSLSISPIHHVCYRCLSSEHGLLVIPSLTFFSFFSSRPSAYLKMLGYPNRTRVDGKFLAPGGIVPSSQAICSSLLEECFEIAQEIKAHEDSKNVASSLKPIYDRLSEIRAELESLVMTHRWSLRETDLFNYSLSLQEIDKMRVDGKFVDSEGNRPPGQYVSCFTIHPVVGHRH